MLKVLADGAESHRLEDNTGRAIGWMDGLGIGFRGFASEAGAIAAVPDAWQALEVMLRREYAGWRRQAPVVERLRVVRTGDTEWVTDGHAYFARLHRPTSDGALTAFALEFALPSFVSQGTRIAAAHAVATAIRNAREQAA
jgi:hypothetical protein